LKKLIENVTIGADPEVFLRNKYTNQFISAIGVLKGTKERPKRFKELGFAVLTDNVLGEFLIPSVTNKKDLVINIQKGIKYIETELPENLEVVITSSAYFDKDQLQTKEAKTFGCLPDFNAWTEEENEFMNAEDSNLRSCGGHIHIGYKDGDNMDTALKLIKALDLFLGVESVLLDEDTKRRKLYGQSGSFRKTSYGVEYRVLSNFWIKSPKSITWIWNKLMEAIKFVNEEHTINVEESEIIQRCINESDESTALYLMDKYAPIKASNLITV